jgi:hypothetical protein
MAVKKKPTTKVVIKPKTDEEMAKLLTSPTVQAALTIQKWQGGTGDINALIDVLSSQIGTVHDGSMKRPETMLFAQAHTLDELFNNLARRAHCQEQMKHYETFLRLAFKAQSQCRSTLETLVAIKNPPVIFAKQANISNGHQQINNGTPAPATRTGEFKNQKNELLEQTHGERLDTRATGKTSGIDTELATVE